jgi:hypothetical protein
MCNKNKLQTVQIWNVLFFILLYRSKKNYFNLLHPVKNEKPIWEVKAI